MFKVKKKNLLLIAGVVWFIAGFNVVRLGLISYSAVESHWYLHPLSLVIFLLFSSMFFKMSRKHTKRIKEYEEYRPFWNFFDRKAYMMMVIMMGGGIYLRRVGVFPDMFVAFFYTGLGLALALAGTLFFKNYFCYDKNCKCPF